MESRKGATQDAYSQRADEVKEVICKMDTDLLWDSIQARDLDPRIIDFVTEQLESGLSAGEVARNLGLPGGKNSKQWKKIQAYFRQGFRADAEVYLYQQTHKYYKVLEKAKVILEEAMEEGTPHLVVYQATENSPGSTEIVKVKGATRELAGFMKAYSDAISLPVRLWKDFGAIGEKKDVGPGGITIVVQNKIPFPSAEEIKAHQEELKAKALAIEVKGKDVTKS